MSSQIGDPTKIEIKTSTLIYLYRMQCIRPRSLDTDTRTNATSNTSHAATLASDTTRRFSLDRRHLLLPLSESGLDAPRKT
jgi:hypothetical protein